MWFFELDMQFNVDKYVMRFLFIWFNFLHHMDLIKLNVDSFMNIIFVLQNSFGAKLHSINIDWAIAVECFSYLLYGHRAHIDIFREESNFEITVD